MGGRDGEAFVEASEERERNKWPAGRGEAGAVGLRTAKWQKLEG